MKIYSDQNYEEILEIKFRIVVSDTSSSKIYKTFNLFPLSDDNGNNEQFNKLVYSKSFRPENRPWRPHCWGYDTDIKNFGK